MENRVTLLVESRIHGDMYVRFGGRQGETYHRNVTRRFLSSLFFLHCENKGYQIPVFMTFEQVMGLNYEGTIKNRKQLTDEEGNPLEKVSVLKGEKSFPVFLTVFTVIDNETKEKIKFDDYKKLSNNEQEKYRVYSNLQVYNVFNINQTNIQERRPELNAKLKA